MTRKSSEERLHSRIREITDEVRELRLQLEREGPRFPRPETSNDAGRTPRKRPPDNHLPARSPGATCLLPDLLIRGGGTAATRPDFGEVPRPMFQRMYVCDPFRDSWGRVIRPRLYGRMEAKGSGAAGWSSSQAMRLSRCYTRGRGHRVRHS